MRAYSSTIADKESRINLSMLGLPQYEKEQERKGTLHARVREVNIL
jgi:hypothetical protein